MKKIKIILMLLSITVLLLLFGCESKTVENSSEKYYKIYFALNDDKTETLSVSEASTVIREIIIGKSLGYTEYKAHGAYVENGMIHENDTLVYLLVFVERKDVESIADEAREKLNLRSILIEEGSAEYDFVQ